MNIAIDTISLLSPLTGVGYYTYHLAKSLQQNSPLHQFTYFYGYYSQTLLEPGQAPYSFFRLKEGLLKIPLLGGFARRAKNLGHFLSSRHFDLYFEPNFIPLNIPSRRLVVAVPDFSFAAFPEWHPKEKIRYFEKHFWRRIRRADRVIVISEFVKKEAIQKFNFPEDWVTAIPLGFNRAIFRLYESSVTQSLKNQYRLPENFILFVGSIEPRKNLNNLLRAYERLRHSVHKESKLVLAGFKGWKNEKIMALIRKLEPNVIFLGYIPEKDLGRLYNLARLFVYPSLYEGFGLPPLEAMACGCPVVVSQTASLPEVCGDAAHYVNPYEVESIADGIEKVLGDDDYRQNLIAKGLARAEQFTWEKSARAHLRVFEETINE